MTGVAGKACVRYCFLFEILFSSFQVRVEQLIAREGWIAWRDVIVFCWLARQLAEDVCWWEELDSGLISSLWREGSFRESGIGGSKSTVVLAARLGEKAVIGGRVSVGAKSHRDRKLLAEVCWWKLDDCVLVDRLGEKGVFGRLVSVGSIAVDRWLALARQQFLGEGRWWELSRSALVARFGGIESSVLEGAKSQRFGGSL